MHAAIVRLVLVLTDIGMAERRGASPSFPDHARAGIPIGLVSIGFAVLWLAVTRTLPVLP